MGIIDIIFLAILVIGFVSGLQKGLISSLLMFAALCLASLAAQALEPALTDRLMDTSFAGWLRVNLEEGVSWEGVFRAGSFTVLFAILYAAFMLVVNLINNVFRLPKLAGADAILGGIIGIVVSYAIICLVVAMLPVLLDPVKEGMAEQLLGESRMGGFFTDSSPLSDLFGIGAKIAGLAK